MITAIVQAHMGSTRLPGKVLIDIQGKPLLEHVIDRVRTARVIDSIVIATTFNEHDKAIIEFAKKLDIPYYVGSEDDVLDRFYQAAKKYKAETIVRITADCPLLDPNVVDEVVSFYLEGNYDYVSNTNPPTFPDGLDTEVFSFESIERAWHEARLCSEREHVTPYIRKHPEVFRIGNVTCKNDLSALRWTVDEDKDMEFVRKVYKQLYTEGMVFYMEDILNLLREHTELLEIQKGIGRDEGYLKSLREDRLFEEKR